MVPQGDQLRSPSLMQLRAKQRIECGWHLFLRWFYEVGASRLAIRSQPLPSKPIIPVAFLLYSISGRCVLLVFVLESGTGLEYGSESVFPVLCFCGCKRLHDMMIERSYQSPSLRLIFMVILCPCCPTC